ncbi:dephospho-CoA kinase [Candidatus Cyanaurora vandensis]|uniref:dephospho-CoA kinase n=1 Tax=Candidatus Cyanaurora vandensis TaxID=2714958 RepID=UPI00257E4EC0|nr:dephospho-CoA kinase [Candidatus Cyanaurora vandensis]
MTRIIGVTGGLGTGKSAVTIVLLSQGIPVWDADQAARRAVIPATPGWQAIVNRYGTTILTGDQLNRARLGEIVFADGLERLWLEGLIHPAVRAEAETWLTNQVATTVALVVPLLFESQMTDLVNEIWVVVCRSDQQIARVQERDGLSEPAIQQRVASQWPLAQKVDRADQVLDNSGDPAALTAQVLGLL